MTDHDSNRHDVEPEPVREDRGTTWALPAIILAIAAIMWASQDREDRVAGNEQPPISRNGPAQTPAAPK
jgi:hypothetical protein